VPFGGFKQSGMGRELGEYALTKYIAFFYLLAQIAHIIPSSYTNVKAVNINFDLKEPEGHGKIWTK